MGKRKESENISHGRRHSIQVLQYMEIRGELSNWSQPLVKAWRHMKAWLIEERIADFV